MTVCCISKPIGIMNCDPALFQLAGEAVLSAFRDGLPAALSGFPCALQIAGLRVAAIHQSSLLRTVRGLFWGQGVQTHRPALHTPLYAVTMKNLRFHRKSAWKRRYFHALGIVIKWKQQIADTNLKGELKWKRLIKITNCWTRCIGTNIIQTIWWTR